jgi:hypothetical protein
MLTAADADFADTVSVLSVTSVVENRSVPSFSR